jgi:hypothetical protein
LHPLKREHSSAGSEHLPYKQRVLGSNPCAPTTMTRVSEGFLLKPFFISINGIHVHPIFEDS